MTSNRRLVFPALIAAGILWGTTVPLSKLALGWLPPAWLAFGRFAVAGALLMLVSRGRLRAAWSPGILISGGLGYGGSVLLQNFGIERTSVTHAALLIGATPVLVAVLAAVLGHSLARPLAWAGFGLSLAGVAVIAGGQGAGSTLAGDVLVLLAQLASAGFTVSQARLLRGRDPVAVTGLQLMAAAALTLPVAAATEHHSAGPVSAAAVFATIGLILAGTVGPTVAFAFGQSRVAADVAGAFLNIEPLVGGLLGMVMFADPAGPAQLAGAAAIVAGIGLSTFEVVAGERRRRAAPAAAVPGAVAVPGSGHTAQNGQPCVSGVAIATANAHADPFCPPAAPPPAAPPPAAVVSRSGEAPSLVRRTRLRRVRRDTVRLARRLRPAGRRRIAHQAGTARRRVDASRRAGGRHR